METIYKAIKLNKLDYYKTHLSIINPVLPVKMTPREIDILASFMILEGSIALDRFGTTAKKMVMETLAIKPSNLSNFMKDLKEKGFIKEINGKLEIWPLLFPEKDKQQYQFRIENLN